MLLIYNSRLGDQIMSCLTCVSTHDESAFYDEYIPGSDGVENETVTLLSSCPLCSCAQTITVSPSVTTYVGCVSPTTTSVANKLRDDNRVCHAWMLALLHYTTLVFASVSHISKYIKT